MSALEEVSGTSSHTELDETLLLDGIDKDDTIDKVTQRNAELEKEIASLKATVEQLKTENKNLQKTSESTRSGSR